jgi:hypothetical protein
MAWNARQALPVRERLLAQLRLSAGEQQDF